MEQSDFQTKNDLLSDPDTRRLVTRFVRKLPKYLKRIENDIEVTDRHDLRLAAHELKGTAASFGYTEIAQVASSLELSANTRSWENLRGQLKKLDGLTTEAISSFLNY